MSKEFKKSKRLLQDVERVEKQQERRAERKCDWKDPRDVLDYRKEERLKRRMSRIPVDFVCRYCGEKKLNWRQWSLKWRACCLQCVGEAKRRFEMTNELKSVESGAGSKKIVLLSDICNELVLRFMLDGEGIRTLREELGITRRQFARASGWGPKYITKLENGLFVSNKEETADSVVKAFEEFGVTFVLDMNTDLLTGPIFQKMISSAEAEKLKG